MATKSGTDAPHRVKDAALRLLDEDAVSAPPSVTESRRPTHGESIEDEEMDARRRRGLAG